MEENKVHFRHIMLFYFWKRKNAAQTAKKIRIVYGDSAVAESTVRKWFTRFRNDNFDLEDREPFEILHISHMSVVRHLKTLEYINRYDVWVPHNLTEKNFMGKSKLKKKLQKQGKLIAKKTEESTSTKVPIDNLPEKFLWMHVKNGTKIRNVLDYALKEFPNYNSIVWTGVGYGIAKTISCAEIFKRKYEGLHQVTKLRYINSEKSKEGTAAKTHRIPEVHILLTKNIKDTTELGYQAPGNCGTFLKNEEATESKTNTTTESTATKSTATESDMPCTDKQSSKMKKNRKRNSMNKPKKTAEPPLKKNKVS